MEFYLSTWNSIFPRGILSFAEFYRSRNSIVRGILSFVEFYLSWNSIFRGILSLQVEFYLSRWNSISPEILCLQVEFYLSTWNSIFQHLCRRGENKMRLQQQLADSRLGWPDLGLPFGLNLLGVDWPKITLPGCGRTLRTRCGCSSNLQIAGSQLGSGAENTARLTPTHSTKWRFLALNGDS